MKGLIITLLLLMPLSLNAGRVDDLEAEVRSLRAQLELAQRREEEYRKEVEALARKVDELELKVGKNKADYSVELEQITKSVSELSEAILETNRAINEINAMLQSMKTAPVSGQADSGPVSRQTPGAAAIKSPAKQLGYKEIYQAAVDQLSKKNYDAAQAQFEAFLKAYPETDLSDNARFWLGECFFAQGNYQRAILEYDAVRKNYPKGNKVPAAYWKMALSFDMLGNRDVAKSFLKELVQKYPGSPEAEKAQKKLGAWE